MSSVAQLFLTAVERHQAGALPEAEELYRRVLRVDARHADALHLLGVAAHQQRRHDEAVALISQAVAINGRSALYQSNLGASLRALGRFDEAEKCYRNAIAFRSDYAEAHYNLGNVLLEQCRVMEAAGTFEQAVRQKPDFADAQHNLGAARRMLGDFGRGWDGYEWRFRCDIQERSLPWPLWDGSSLEGKTLLVYAEQGIGDEMMFASCLPDVANRAERCVFECDPRLAPLASRSFPNVIVVPRRDDFRLSADDVPVHIDLRISAGSLPRYFRRDESAFPNRGRFLVADENATGRWRSRLAGLGPGLKVGISWRGGKRAEARARRSIALSQWKPILSVPGVQFVSLQYDGSCEELHSIFEECGVRIHDWADADRRANLDDLAAEITALDLVISVDNSTVHLAGALGVPTWVLLPFVADWRWMLDREDSPWYPSVRLFRQPSSREWNTPIMRTATALARRVRKS